MLRWLMMIVRFPLFQLDSLRVVKIDCNCIGQVYRSEAMDFGLSCHETTSELPKLCLLMNCRLQIGVRRPLLICLQGITEHYKCHIFCIVATSCYNPEGRISHGIPGQAAWGLSD